MGTDTETTPLHSQSFVSIIKRAEIPGVIHHYPEALLRLKADDYVSYNYLGIALAKKGQINEAISQFREAIRLKPDYADAHYNLGNAFFTKSQTDEAISEYREAIRLRPDYTRSTTTSALHWAGKAEPTKPSASSAKPSASTRITPTRKIIWRRHWNRKANRTNQ